MASDEVAKAAEPTPAAVTAAEPAPAPAPVSASEPSASGVLPSQHWAETGMPEVHLGHAPYKRDTLTHPHHDSPWETTAAKPTPTLPLVMGRARLTPWPRPFSNTGRFSAVPTMASEETPSTGELSWCSHSWRPRCSRMRQGHERRAVERGSRHQVCFTCWSSAYE